MRRMTILLSLMLVAGCASQPPATPPPVLNEEPGPQPAVQPPAPVPAPAQPPDPCAGQDDLVRANLRLAAEAKLPVPNVIVYTMLEQMIGTEAFKSAHQVDPTPEVIARQAEQGDWTFLGEQATMALIVKTEPEQTGTGMQFRKYAFDGGSLSATSPVPELADRFHAELAAGKALASGGTASVPNPPPDKFRIWWGTIDPKQVLTAGWGRCTLKMIDTYQDGRIARVTLPMIDLANAAYLGFADGHLVTHSIKSGTYMSEWYSIPGIKGLAAGAHSS